MQTTNTEKGKVRPDEVMIGNYLRTTLTDKIIEVDWLAIKHLHDGNIQAVGYDHSSVYEPIPLTEQWLKELGFEQRTKQSLELYGSCHYYINYDGEYHRHFYLWFKDGKHLFHYGERTSIIQYVHQIQNLYFALTHTHLHRTNTQKHGK